MLRTAGHCDQSRLALSSASCIQSSGLPPAMPEHNDGATVAHFLSTLDARGQLASVPGGSAGVWPTKPPPGICTVPDAYRIIVAADLPGAGAAALDPPPTTPARSSGRSAAGAAPTPPRPPQLSVGFSSMRSITSTFTGRLVCSSFSPSCFATASGRERAPFGSDAAATLSAGDAPELPPLLS